MLPRDPSNQNYDLIYQNIFLYRSSHNYQVYSISDDINLEVPCPRGPSVSYCLGAPHLVDQTTYSVSFI